MKKKSHLPSVRDAIEFRRDQYGWTKNKMATELHISPSHYSDFIAGRRNITTIAMKHAYRVGVPVEVLLQLT